MKMTKQTKAMINAVNVHLRNNHIKDEANPIFAVTMFALLNADCYQGFNYFTKDSQLSGGPNEKFDHLEFIIA